MKIYRLLEILSILANTDRITIKELADRFEVSKRTIFRDLDTLNKSGVPIVTYSEIGGGVAVVEGYKLKNSILSKNDIKNVFTALNGLMSIDENTDLTNLMAKLIPKDASKVFSESDYVLDLSSWFKDSIIKKRFWIYIRQLKILAPRALKEKVKAQIKKINLLYKDYR